ncbi:MAG TPA: molybdate ABC transporter substrate-binding protein [Pedococcus sp.]|jgi:molybdate transport system substrate-binding protein
MSRTSNRLLAVVTAVVLVSTAAACGSSGHGSTKGAGASGSSSSSGLSGEITVYAAASLKKTFTEIGTQVQAAHPGTTVRFSFAGSSDLAAQLQQGAPADVFASADTRNMAKVSGAGLTAAAPVDFATNTLEIAVPPGNPARISSLRDLTRPGVTVVVCAPQVPCGGASVKVEQAAGLTLKPVSEEQDVTDVLGKVVTGEADAGLVYVTDVKGAGDEVEGVEFPESTAAANTYPIAVLKSSTNPALASAFLSAVTGVQGQRVLASAGFTKAP